MAKYRNLLKVKPCRYPCRIATTTAASLPTLFSSLFFRPSSSLYG